MYGMCKGLPEGGAVRIMLYLIIHWNHLLEIEMQKYDMQKYVIAYHTIAFYNTPNEYRLHVIYGFSL